MLIQRYILLPPPPTFLLRYNYYRSQQEILLIILGLIFLQNNPKRVQSYHCTHCKPKRLMPASFCTVFHNAALFLVFAFSDLKDEHKQKNSFETKR